MAAADTARLIASLELRDKEFQAAINRSLKGVDKMESRLSRIGSHASAGLKSAGQNIEKGIVIGATAAAGALTYAVKAATDWESAVAGVNKTIDATPAELKEITDGLIAMSNRMPTSANELAAIAETAGALGVARKDIISFTETVAILGATTNVTTDEAATALGQLQNSLGLTGDEFDNFASSLVDLGNKGASTETQILNIASRSGAAAKLIGVAKDATLGWAAAAANLGIEEELAGTSLQRFFIQSQTLISAGGKNLDKFATISGKTAAQFKKDFAEDASGALEDFLRGLGKMPKDQRIQAVQKLFGKGTGLTRLILGLSDSIDKNLTPSLDTSTEAWANNTAATEEARKRFATTASQLSTLKNNLHNASVIIGSELLPVLADLSREAVTWLQDPATQAGIKAFAKDLAVGARDAVKWLKSLDWNAIANALKSAGGFAKGIVEAFLAAPPWVQQFLAAGFVANKFTGGAIGSIVGELGKGLIRGVLGMNAGIVNINAGVVNGGVGAAGGAAAGRGLASKALGLVTAVTIVGMAASVAELIHGAISPGGGLQGRQQAGTELPADQLQWPFGPKNTPKLDFGPFQNILGGDSAFPSSKNNDVPKIIGRLNEVKGSVDRSKDDTVAAVNRNATLLTAAAGRSSAEQKAAIASASAQQLAAIGAQKAANQQAAFSIRDKVASTSAAETAATREVRTAAATAGVVARSGGQQAAAAIRDKDLSVEVNVAAPKVSIHNIISGQNKVKTIYRTQS